MFGLFGKRKAVAPEVGAASSWRVPGDRVLVHATHPKAGSQWVQAILCDLLGDAAVPNLEGNGVPKDGRFSTGRMYLSVYLPPDEIAALCGAGVKNVPFFVMRDLRDTLVSLYFSLKVSHEVLDEFMASARKKLNTMSEEDGLIYLIETQLRNSAKLQNAWIAHAPERCIHFEKLTAEPETEMPRVIRDWLDLDIPESAIVESCRKFAFEKLTGGRKKGEEDAKSHFRRGAAGGWRKHFTPAVAEAFDDEFPGLLARTGYGE